MASAGLITSIFMPVLTVNAQGLGLPEGTSVKLHTLIGGSPVADVPTYDFYYDMSAYSLDEDASASTVNAMPHLTISKTSNGTSGQHVSTVEPYTVEANKEATLEFKYNPVGTLETTDSDGVAWPHAGIYTYRVTQVLFEGADTSWHLNYNNNSYLMSIYVANVGETLETQYVKIMGYDSETKATGDEFSFEQVYIQSMNMICSQLVPLLQGKIQI